jgi:hypothetical protein
MRDENFVIWHDMYDISEEKECTDKKFVRRGKQLQTGILLTCALSGRDAKMSLSSIDITRFLSTLCQG